MNSHITFDEKVIIVDDDEIIGNDDLDELLPGMSAWDFSDAIRNKELVPYSLRKTVRCKNGEIKSYLHEILHVDCPVGYFEMPDFKQHVIVFFKSNVETFKRNHPDFTQTVDVTLINASNVTFDEKTNTVKVFNPFKCKQDELEKFISKDNKHNVPIKTNIGSVIATEKRLKTWQEVFIPAMIRVAMQCQAEGPNARRQKKDILGMLESKVPEGTSIPDAVIRCLYAALPDDYVDRRGGNTKA